MEQKRVVILGAGYAGLKAALGLERLLSQQEAEVTLVNKHSYHQFITQLHEPAAGRNEFDDVRIELKEILNPDKTRLVKGSISKIDVTGKNIDLIEQGEQVPYDYLLIALGSEPEYFDISGMKEHALALRSLNAAKMIHTHIQSMFALSKNTPKREEREALLTFIIGGGGLTGVEFAGELADWVPKLAKRYGVFPGEVQVYNIEVSAHILPGFEPDLVAYAEKVLQEKGVKFINGKGIATVTKQDITLASGEIIPTHSVIWAGGVRGNPLVEESGLAVALRGRAVVNEFLQVPDHPEIFCAGDCALAKDPRTGLPVTPNAQMAMAQGSLVAKNIHASITGQPMYPFDASSAGVLISLGRGQGVGKVGRFRPRGYPAVLLKEFIPLRYKYSLGGLRLLVRMMFKG
ncbi:MAG: NAD(P)/FAD-dependent oxidoreductase [Bacillota bacterium]